MIEITKVYVLTCLYHDGTDGSHEVDVVGVYDSAEKAVMALEAEYNQVYEMQVLDENGDETYNYDCELNTEDWIAEITGLEDDYRWHWEIDKRVLN